MMENVIWSEIGKKYPNQWAFITNIKMKDGAIDRCDVLKICSKKDKVRWIKYYKAKGISYECERTTYSDFWREEIF